MRNAFLSLMKGYINPFLFLNENELIPFTEKRNSSSWRKLGKCFPPFSERGEPSFLFWRKEKRVLSHEKWEGSPPFSFPNEKSFTPSLMEETPFSFSIGRWEKWHFLLLNRSLILVFDFRSDSNLSSKIQINPFKMANLTWPKKSNKLAE